MILSYVSNLFFSSCLICSLSYFLLSQTFVNSFTVFNTCFMASSSSFNLFSSSCCICPCLISSSFLQISMLFQTYLLHGFLFHFQYVLFLSHIYSFSYGLTCFMASSSIFNLFSFSLTFILSLTVLPVSLLHLPFSICSLRLVSFVLVLSLPLSSFLLLTELDAIIVIQGFLLFFLLLLKT